MYYGGVIIIFLIYASMPVQTFPEVMSQSVNFVWSSLAVYIPRLFLAIVLFIVFLMIGATLGGLVARFVAMLKIEGLLEKTGVEGIVRRFGLNLHVGNFIGWLVKWFFIITGLLVAANLLNLAQVSDFLTQVLYYIPNVAVAVVILGAGTLVADFLGVATSSSISASGLRSGPFVAKVVKWAVFIFAFITALDQLGVAQTFVNTMYIGLVGMIALAGGLAFGLGGKEHAAEFLSKIKRDIAK